MAWELAYDTCADMRVGVGFAIAEEKAKARPPGKSFATFALPCTCSCEQADSGKLTIKEAIMMPNPEPSRGRRRNPASYKQNTEQGRGLFNLGLPPVSCRVVLVTGFCGLSSTPFVAQM